MKTTRTYGNEPYNVVVIHGGPGAPGYMAPVARVLSRERGVIETIHRAATLDGQVGEILSPVRRYGKGPVTLVGHSWGAMLAYVFSAKYPKMVKRLIMVSSAVFETGYEEAIMKTRRARLGVDEISELGKLMKRLIDPWERDKNRIFTRLGEMTMKTDSVDLLLRKMEMPECDYDVFCSVWDDAEELRSSGELLGLATKIKCPVVAIHGDHDPHPVEGVREPLSRVLGDFRFIVLEKCGHYPWLEKYARDLFYGILRNEIL